ncbi:MAG: DNA polymerase III subunit delta [Bacteroidia bacterium]|nr:DNA polymerase III subunit delta [Bacteroidia bacterium]MDW8334896.1 DNA polymerase III subunit delta [Bacteroidia bacterium]
MSEFQTLEREIRAGKFAASYCFYGEEPYLMDRLVEALTETAIPAGLRDFNFEVVYGPDVTAREVTARARAYPTMAPRRVVVLKEAQRMRKEEREKLNAYLENPSPATVFVMIFQQKQSPFNLQTKTGKAIAQKVRFFESAMLYENEAARWVEARLRERRMQITPEALTIFVQSVGVGLYSLENEIQKIFLHFAGRENVVLDKETIYDFVSLDKDYNVFELMDRLGERDAPRAHRIVHRMMSNVKDHPPVALTVQLFSFYRNLAMLKQQRIEKEKDVAEALKIHPFLARRYVNALKLYSLARIHQNLEYIAEADLALKGITPTRMGEAAVVKTLVYNLLT